MEIVLLILVIVLFGLFFWQKKNSDESIKTIDEFQQKTKTEMESQLDDMNGAFSKSIEEVSVSVKVLSESLDDSTQTLRKSIQGMKENAEKLKSDVDIEFETIDQRIAKLTELLKITLEDNAKLKKDLRFFTEIGSDATKLNETEDEATTEKLIQEALTEISSVRIKKKAESQQKKISDEATAENLVRISENAGTKVTLGVPSILDDEQKEAFNTMMNTDHNMFITGKAGTGKSFLLRLFVRANSKKKVVLLAPTGISAINIDGATIHTAFGYKNLVNASLEELEQGKLQLNSNKRKVLEKVDTIVIDEISMVRADTFEKMDRILKQIMQNDKLFGGKQMILFGDLFQLPPITKSEEYRFLNDRFGGIYFFNSDAYKAGNFNFIELSINHRQKDDEPFFNLLNRIREGKVGNQDLAVLNSRTNYSEEDLRRVIRLFPRKDEAESVNREELEKINAKLYEYEAKVIYTKSNMTKTMKENTFPISKTLKLKLGALIMMVANDTEKRWANGTLGIVSGLGDDFIKVNINGVEYSLSPYEFEEQEAIYKNGRIQYETIYKVEQYPLVLAYAITIHKSQGMTYQQVACDISHCFSPGQAYVALSRCSSLSGLYLLNSVNSDILSVDQDIKEFYLSNINVVQ